MDCHFLLETLSSVTHTVLSPLESSSLSSLLTIPALPAPQKQARHPKFCSPDCLLHTSSGGGGILPLCLASSSAHDFQVCVSSSLSLSDFTPIFLTTLYSFSQSLWTVHSVVKMDVVSPLVELTHHPGRPFPGIQSHH